MVCYRLYGSVIFLSFNLCPISLVSLPDLAFDSCPFVPIFLWWKSFTQEHVRLRNELAIDTRKLLTSGMNCMPFDYCKK